MLFGHRAFKESRYWEHIFSTCQVYQRQKSSGWQSVGMGFDGTATFSGKKTAFVHCHWYLLQLACAQAANNMTGIKHVYTTLTRSGSIFTTLLNEQNVWKRSSMSLINQKWRSSSYLTRCLAHEWCVKAVKVSYTALVVTLDNNYQNFHAPEALELYKVLSKFTTIATIYPLDYTLPFQAQKKSSNKAIWFSHVLFSCRCSFPRTGWCHYSEASWFWNFWIPRTSASREIVSADKINIFHEVVGTPFVALQKNISGQFVIHDIVSALAIFDPYNVPSTDSYQFPTYGKKSIEVLLNYFG